MYILREPGIQVCEIKLQSLEFILLHFNPILDQKAAALLENVFPTKPL